MGHAGGFMRIFAGLIACLRSFRKSPAAQAPTEPLAVARILAAKYPAQPIMSYIPALSWSSSLRLSELTGEPQWREKVEKDIEPFTSDPAKTMAEPRRLTSLAGAFAFLDAWVLARNAAAQKVGMEVAPLMLPQTPGEVVRYATGWTDDMFMASSVLSRIGSVEYAATVGKLLTTYAGKLQRPDGIFIHADRRPARVGPRQRLRAARRDRGADLPARKAGAIARACSRSIASTSRRWRSSSQTTAVGGRSSMSRRVIAS